MAALILKIIINADEFDENRDKFDEDAKETTIEAGNVVQGVAWLYGGIDFGMI